MADNFNTPVSASSKDEWLTPPDIIRALGEFDLDPCAPVNRRWDMAKRHYSILDGGMQKDWAGRVWLNPPYGDQTFHWLARGARHGDTVALIFARTETKGFHSEVWGNADAIFFFKGRLKFFHVDGRQADGAANAPSCLVAYGQSNVRALRDAAAAGLIRGRFILLKDAAAAPVPAANTGLNSGDLPLLSMLPLTGKGGALPAFA